MARILVTGGTGMVGSHLRELIPTADFVGSRDCDLRNFPEVDELLSKGWDRVIHLAARVGGILDNIESPAEFIEDNLLMNTNLIRAARIHGVPRLTAVLSTCIYPDTVNQYPMTEEMLHEGPPQSTNFAYATAKRAMAVQIDSYNRQYGLQYNYLIPSNLYGEHDSIDFKKSHFLTALIGKLVKAKTTEEGTVRLLGTGAPLRQFLYAGDLARILVEVVDRDLTDSFNVAAPGNLSIREVAVIAAEACGFDGLEIVFDNASPDGQFRKDVSIERFKRLMPDFEFTPIELGIRRVFDSYLAAYNQ